MFYFLSPKAINGGSVLCPINMICLNIVLSQKHFSKTVLLLINIILILKYSKQKINYREYIKTMNLGNIFISAYFISKDDLYIK